MIADPPAVLNVKNDSDNSDNVMVMEEILVEEIQVFVDDVIPSMDFFITDDNTHVIPDSGFHTWLVILGTFIAHVTVDGMLNSFGLFLVAYISVQSAFSHVSQTLLSLIPSFSARFCQIFSIFTGRIAEHFFWISNHDYAW